MSTGQISKCPKKQDNFTLEAQGSDLPGSPFIWSLHALDQCVLAEVLISVC